MPNNHPAISVIIPVYNVSLYLSRCLDSVVNQTFSDLEIIVVNDGSTDNSLAIIREFMEKDERIKLVDKKNEGLSYARKSGVEVATGTYIHHLDGDDYLEEDAYAELHEKTRISEADAVLFDFWFDYENESRLEHSRKYDAETYDPVSVLKYIFEEKGHNAIWHILHKRSLYENDIRFYPNLSIGEDLVLTTQLLYHAQKIVTYSEKPLLHYMIRSGSIMNTTFDAKKEADYLLYPAIIREFLLQKPEYADLAPAVAQMTLIAYVTIVRSDYMNHIYNISNEVMRLTSEFPKLKKARHIKSFFKLFKAYHIHPFAGHLMAAYYRKKNKINRC